MAACAQPIHSHPISRTQPCSSDELLHQWNYRACLCALQWHAVVIDQIKPSDHNLLMPQYDQRIRLGSPVRRKVGRKQRGADQQQGQNNEGCGIYCANAKQQARNQSGKAQRHDNPGRHGRESKPQRFIQHEPEISNRGPERSRAALLALSVIPRRRATVFPRSQSSSYSLRRVAFWIRFWIAHWLPCAPSISGLPRRKGGRGILFSDNIQYHM